MTPAELVAVRRRYNALRRANAVAERQERLLTVAAYAVHGTFLAVLAWLWSVTL